jgi:hypothetical protein
MKTDKDDRAEDEADAKDRNWHWADPKSLKVNPAFRRLIPLQSREEFRALEAGIEVEGCRDPLTVWKGHNVIPDGHTRHELCPGHKLKVEDGDPEIKRKLAGAAGAPGGDGGEGAHEAEPRGREGDSGAVEEEEGVTASRRTGRCGGTGAASRNRIGS